MKAETAVGAGFPSKNTTGVEIISTPVSLFIGSASVRRLGSA
jgi:hypothetical protein